MKAGYSRVCMNPPNGTRMMGFGNRDLNEPSEGIRDDVFVRALYLEHDDEAVIIVSYDMCFIGRHDSDRFKGALGNLTDMSPRQIVLQSTHNHVGPASGIWAYGAYLQPECLYMDQLEQWTIEAVSAAVAEARNVTVHAGVGKSKVPMNRRTVVEPGRTVNAPNPQGIVVDDLPLLRLIDDEDKTVAIAFSVAAHPSIVTGPLVSGEYPGKACAVVDEHVGHPCAIFLQGCAGDAKTSLAGANGQKWEMGFEMADAVGEMLGREVIELLDGDALSQRKPRVASALEETFWPLTAIPSLDEMKKLAGDITQQYDAKREDLYTLAMKRQVELIERGTPVRTACSVIMQGIQVADDVRMIFIEGEPVAEHGLDVINHFGGGVTFALGYANGESMYLPCTRQLTERGYEVTSGLEYGYAGELAPGMENVVRETLEAFSEMGIG